jgi:hypothetical protein
MDLFIVGHGFQLHKPYQPDQNAPGYQNRDDLPQVQPNPNLPDYQPNPHTTFTVPANVRVHFYARAGCGFEEQWEFSIRRHVCKGEARPTKQLVDNQAWEPNPTIFSGGDVCPNVVLTRPGNERTIVSFGDMKGISVKYDKELPVIVTVPALADKDTLAVKQGGKISPHPFDPSTNTDPWYTYLENVVSAIVASVKPTPEKPVDIHWCVCRSFENPLEEIVGEDSPKVQAQNAWKGLLKEEHEVKTLTASKGSQT